MSTYLRQNSFKFVRQESFNELHNSLFLFIGFQIVQFYFILPLEAGVLSISRSPIPLSTLTLPPPSQDRDTSHGLRQSFHEEPGISLRLKHSTDVNRCELKKTLSNVIIQRNFLHGHHIITDLSKPKKNKSSVRFFPNKVHTDCLSFSLLLAHKGGHMKHKFSFWSHSQEQEASVFMVSYEWTNTNKNFFLMNMEKYSFVYFKQVRSLGFGQPFWVTSNLKILHRILILVVY